MGWMRLSAANLRQACQWALEGHQRFSGNLAPVTVEEYAALIKGTLLDVAPVPEIDTEQLEKGGAIQAKQEFLVSHGAIPRDTPFSKIKDSFDGQLVLDVTAEPAKYCLSEYNFDGEVR
jgi:NitT/TauT family transport system substrate-binding protein